jgi:hypothetical protein
VQCENYKRTINDVGEASTHRYLPHSSNYAPFSLSQPSLLGKDGGHDSTEYKPQTTQTKAVTFIHCVQFMSSVRNTPPLKTGVQNIK